MASSCWNAETTGAERVVMQRQVVQRWMCCIPQTARCESASSGEVRRLRTPESDTGVTLNNYSLCESGRVPRVPFPSPDSRLPTLPSPDSCDPESPRLPGPAADSRLFAHFLRTFPTLFPHFSQHPAASFHPLNFQQKRTYQILLLLSIKMTMR